MMSAILGVDTVSSLSQDHHFKRIAKEAIFLLVSIKIPLKYMVMEMFRKVFTAYN